MNQVWVFSGDKNHFPSAIFTTRELAESWISQHQLTGTLTAYPVNVSVYDWAIEKGYFKPAHDYQFMGKFISNFSSASQEHYHFGGEDE